MPWCETCAKFWNPSSLPENGLCPTCGRPVDVVVRSASDVVVEDTDVHVPWHFKLMVVSLVAYLGWRLIQAVLWVL